MERSRPIFSIFNAGGALSPPRRGGDGLCHLYARFLPRIVSGANPGAQRFKGYTAAEIIGHHFSRFYSEEDQKAGLPARALERPPAREGKFETEGWRIRNDGTRFWAFVVIDPIRDPSGEIIGFAKITRDLTERKAAEEKLKQSEQQFRLLVQGVTDYAIYLLDLDGRVTNWNPGAQRIKGYLPHEIIGQHFSRFYTDEDRATNEPQKALETVQRDGRFEKENWRVRKDGTRFWAHVVIDAVRNEAGEIVGYAKITRDITELKEAQEKLEKVREVSLQSQKMEAIGQLTGASPTILITCSRLCLAASSCCASVCPTTPKAWRCLKTQPKARSGAQALDSAHAHLRAKPGAQAGSDRYSRTRARDQRAPSTKPRAIAQDRDPFPSRPQSDRGGC